MKAIVGRDSDQRGSEGFVALHLGPKRPPPAATLVAIQAAVPAALPEAAVAMAGLIRVDRERRKPDAERWPDFAKAAGLDPAAPGANLLGRTDEWHLSVRPVYAPEVRGRIQLEDETAETKRLNDEVGRQGLLGQQAPPIRVRWTVKSETVGTGKPVAVEVGTSPSRRAVRVSRRAGVSGPPKLVVRAPSRLDGAGLKITVVAHAVDRLGRRSSSSKVLWTHRLGIEGRSRAQVSALVQVATGSQGGPEVGEFELAQPGCEPIDVSRRAPRQVARTLAATAAHSGSLDLDDLRQIVQAARRARSP